MPTETAQSTTTLHIPTDQPRPVEEGQHNSNENSTNVPNGSSDHHNHQPTVTQSRPTTYISQNAATHRSLATAIDHRPHTDEPAQEAVNLTFELPVSEVLTYKISTTLYPASEPAVGGAGTPMLELSAILNIEIEPEDTDGLHPFTYWFDSFELTLFGLPFHHLLGPERWSGTFTPQRELLDVEEPPILSELGIIMALMLADIFVPAPERPVSVGDTWEVGYQLTSDIAKLELDISTRYTLLSYDPESGTAQLSEASFVVYETVLEPNPGVFIQAKGEMTTEGESVIDLQTGLRLRLTGRSLEALNMTLPTADANEAAIGETVYYASESTLERIGPIE